MTTVYQCPQCEYVVSTESTTAGAFELPPDVTCERCGVEMDVIA